MELFSNYSFPLRTYTDTWERDPRKDLPQRFFPLLRSVEKEGKVVNKIKRITRDLQSL